MNDILDLGGRVALVTGAGQGVGRQIALHLATAKNSGGVAVNDYYLERAESVVAEIKSAGGKAIAVRGDVGLEIYAGAKAGAAGFMRSNARSLGRFMITANCIAIGMTATPAIERRLSDQEGLKRSLERYIIRRVGEPTDVANMALFLASDASSWITGQTYPVN